MQTDQATSVEHASSKNISITANFFRKLELYQELILLNKLFCYNVTKDNAGASKNTWEIEKKVLFWTRFGHKHLGSSLKAEEFRDENAQRLKDLRLTKEEVIDKQGDGQYWLRNLVERGFAYAPKDGGRRRGIIISQRGLLMGVVIADVYRLKKINDQKWWNKSLWNKYAEKYGGEHFLAKTLKYWWYRLIIISAWSLVIATAITILMVLINRISADINLPNVKINSTSAPLLLNVTGLSLIFMGSALVTYTIGRWGAQKSWRYRAGNVLQGIGFIVSLIAIFLNK